MTDRFTREGRNTLTEDDILDIEAEFGVEVPRETIIAGFADGKEATLLHCGRRWGWDDTEARADLAILLGVADQF